jgi:hypothetical protein
MTGGQRVRWVMNLANLSTPLGMLLARLGRASGVTRGGDGIRVYGGYRLPVPNAPAFTVGNVVLVRDVQDLTDRPLLLAHETRHSTQYAFCLGPVMLPLYLLGAGVSLLLCGDYASYNPFERLAGLADGGYEQRPLRF